MTLGTRVPHVIAPLLLSAFGLLVVACGGRTVGLGNPGGPLVDAGTPIADSSTGTCVNVDLGAFDQSCSSDTDCMLVRTGTLCDGQCDCGGDSAINVSGASLYSEETKGISFEPCHCPEVGAAQCLAGQCSFCPAGEDCVGISRDAGTGDDTGVVTFDSGIGPEDASVDAESTCVEIELSSYDTSCNQDSDCFVIQTGQVCDGDCECGGEPINVSGEAQYEQAVSGIQFGECGCPSGPTPSCVGGQCTEVGLGG
jgi:hypothetical protein